MIMMMMTNDMMQLVKTQGEMMKMVINSIIMNMPHWIVWVGWVYKHCNWKRGDWFVKNWNHDW